MGKVDRTEDEIFNEHLQNFSKQQNSANKLQKEFTNYIRCVRGKSVKIITIYVLVSLASYSRLCQSMTLIFEMYNYKLILF